MNEPISVEFLVATLKPDSFIVDHSLVHRGLQLQD